MSGECVQRSAPLPGERLVVGVGDMKASADDTLLVTYALGSCLGIAIHDPVSGVGGLLHAMLPKPCAGDPGAEQNPFMYVDLGVPAMFQACYELGLQKQRARIYVAGGACLRNNPEEDIFRIGFKNIDMLEKLLKVNGLWPDEQDVGGSLARTLILDVGTGSVHIETAKGRNTL